VSTNLEIAQLKERTRKHVVEKEKFKRVIASWEDGEVPRYEAVCSYHQYFTWIVLAIKELRYIKRVNEKLRTKSE